MAVFTRGLAALTLAGTALASQQAQAQAVSETVPFTGSVPSYCQLVVDPANGGELGVSPDYTTLSSRQYGGKAGKVTVQPNGGNYNVKAGAPDQWGTKPAGLAGTTTFEATLKDPADDTYKTTAIALAEKRTLSVGLVATNDAPLAAGDYEAEVTVTCEPATTP